MALIRDLYNIVLPNYWLGGVKSESVHHSLAGLNKNWAMCQLWQDVATGVYGWSAEVSANVRVVRVKTIDKYWRNGDIAPFIFYLGPLWKWVVSCTLRPLRAWGNISRFIWARRLWGPQGRSGKFGEVKHLLPLQEIQPWFMGRWERLRHPSCV